MDRSRGLVLLAVCLHRSPSSSSWCVHRFDFRIAFVKRRAGAPGFFTGRNRTVRFGTGRLVSQGIDEGAFFSPHKPESGGVGLHCFFYRREHRFCAHPVPVPGGRASLFRGIFSAPGLFSCPFFHQAVDAPVTLSCCIEKYMVFRYYTANFPGLMGY